MESNIIKENIKYMESAKEGGMEELLIKAQSLRPDTSFPGASYADVAFYFNDKTGQIGGFTRVDLIDEEEKRHYGIWKITIAMDLESGSIKNIFYRISDVKYPNGVSKNTEKIINESIKFYNQKHHGSFDN